MPDTHHPTKVARSGMIYTGTLILQKVLSFTYFSFIASALGPANLGRYTFVLSFAAFFSLVVDFGFVNMAIRRFAQLEKAKEDYFRTLFTTRLFLAVIGAALLFLTAGFLGYDKNLLTLLSITALIMVMDAFTAFFYTVFRARQNLFYESLGTIVFQIVIVAAGLFTLARTHDLRRLLLVIALGSGWHVIYSLWLAIRRAHFSIKLKFNLSQIKAVLVAAWPFFLAA
ncbi:MAG: oligosaccharide flippase family protein, partial [Candidatus Komeilibacteria bacterium]|nr:oligosaccharide flippase family protein [Candidatus Komeilibacteria bacterium]